MKTSIEKKSVWTPLKTAPESARISSFYGFTPIEGVRTKAGDTGRTERLIEVTEAKHIPLPQPLMLWEKTPDGRSSTHRIECTLSVIGSGKSITEILLIQAARAILEHAGWKKLLVKVNSIGNKESVAEFERKTNAFIRKHLNEFPPELRQLLKKDPFYLARTTEEKYKNWNEAAPQSIDCLGDESRLHFKEILEFLESANIPYMIDGTLLGDLSVASETVFEIVSDDEKPELLASGSRYNRLSKKLQLKRELPAADVRISAKVPKLQKTIALKETKPKFYLVQFGPEAKQKSIIVLEKLRKAGAPVFHSLVKDKLTGQILSAEQMGIPYIILLGQKEALENCVVIRNALNRSQHSISIEELTDFVKTLK